MLCVRCAINERHNKYYCKPCIKEMDLISYHKNRDKILKRRKKDRIILKEWLISLKENKPCCDCNKIYPHWIMQWDHLPQYERKGDVSSLGSKKLIIEEIKKCELVCANCHAERTHTRRISLPGKTRLL